MMYSQIKVSDGAVFCDYLFDVIWTAGCSKYGS